MQSQKITFLGPFGVTFSHEGYEALANLFHAPDPKEDAYIPATTNSQVIELIAEHGGYGALAFETWAEGFLVESFDSLINLLKIYKRPSDCPFHIIGAIQQQIHFAVMARPGVKLNSIEKIIAHPRALGACKQNIARIGLQTASVSSNGEAARLVAESDDYKNYAALAPKTAAKKYGLKVLENSFEDEKAVTTFHLIGPKKHLAPVGKKNCVIVIYKIPNEPGALLKSLTFLKNLNLIKIHSAYSGKGTYYIGIEIEVKEDELPILDEILLKFKNHTERHLVFGPFSICS